MTDTREIAAAVAQLMAQYWPRDRLQSMSREWMLEWLEKLRDIAPQTVATACAKWRASQLKPPTPDDIRALCLEAQRPAASTEADARRTADAWARGHGYADLDRYLAETWPSSGITIRTPDGRKWRFAGIRQEPPRPPLASLSAQPARREWAPTPEQMAAGRAALGLAEPAA